jgi:dolichyl-phosphate beta-glucosyltransferase
MATKLTLSLIVPAYNEEDIIRENLQKIISFLKAKSFAWEIIVVSDGSTDATMQIVQSMKNKNIKIFELDQNRGKGAALRKGVREANGEYVLFTDADLSVSIQYLDDVMVALKKTDVVIASRRVKGAKILRHQPFIRENMGRVFTKLTQLMLGSSISDFTCGFKGFRANVAKKVFSEGKLDRWAYDSEIIFLANKYGYSISEVPIVWENRVESRVKMGSAALTSFIDLLKIRLYDLEGKYAK